MSLSAGAQAASNMSEPKIYKGLDGICADRTAISTVGKGDAGLTYRGYDIEGLARHADFEEVAHLLMHGELPTAAQKSAYMARLAPMRALPKPLCDVLERLPAHTHPMDVLRTGCSVMGALEPESETFQGTEVAERVMAQFGSMINYWHHWHASGTRIVPNVDPAETLASSFLKMLRQDGREPDPLHVKVINASLILYAEHDLAASTFASRVTASTLSDTYSSLCTAIGTLRGPLHGGANEAVQHMIDPLRDPDHAEAVLTEKLARRELVMGFGHRIYKNGDPRNAVFKDLSRQLSVRADGSPRLFAVSERMEAVMAEKKNMYPNADFYAASAYHQCGVPTSFFTPIFVVGRTSGWMAHVSEQRVGNKIIRPTSAYIGPPPRDYVPVEARKATTPQSKL